MILQETLDFSFVLHMQQVEKKNLRSENKFFPDWIPSQKSNNTDSQKIEEQSSE